MKQLKFYKSAKNQQTTKGGNAFTKTSRLRAYIAFIFIFISLSISASFKVSGIVTDNYNAPLPGVTVVEKGTSNGVITDSDGKYSINVSSKNSVLVFSFIGFEAKEMNIKGQSAISIQLKEAETRLDECVVVGYATCQKSILTGSVYSVQNNAPGRIRKTRDTNQHNTISQVYYDAEYNTEAYSSINENGYKSPKDEPLSTFSVDVDRASYSNVRRYLNNGELPPEDAVRVEEMINYFDYSYKAPEDDSPFSINKELGMAPWNKEHYLCESRVEY